MMCDMKNRFIAFTLLVFSAVGGSAFGAGLAHTLPAPLVPATGSSGPFPGWTVVQTIQLRLGLAGINRESAAGVDTTSREVCTILRHSDDGKADARRYVVSRGYAPGWEEGYTLGTMVHVRCAEYAGILTSS